MLNNQKSFTLIEVLVSTFLILVVFLGVFGSYQLALRVVGLSKSKIAAISIANAEIEKIRILPYSLVGVSGGFPDGALEATKTKTINGIEYTINSSVDYVVDSSDGIVLPDDECPNDYKKAEVKVSWPGLFGGEIKMTTDVSPENLAQECAEAGGILKVSVFDAFGVMVPSPLIEVKDPSTDNLIKSATPDSGEHYFSLSPDTYKIVVSKQNYSTSRTYGTDEVAIPEKPHSIVLEGQLTEISFSIDKVSSFSVDTLSPWVIEYFSDSFFDQSKVSEFLDLSIGEGEVVLAEEAPSQYKTSGYLVSIDISPGSLIEWEEFSWTDDEFTGTQILYSVLYFDGADWVLVPDSDLPGNSLGFEVSPVDLSNLDPAVYSQLRIKANFSTSDNTVSPILYDWQVSYKASGATPIPNASFHLQGEKIIGKDASEDPVYKYSQDHSSDTTGHIDISNLEWDNYTFSVDPATGLDLVDINPSPQPISLSPNTNLSIVLFLEAQNSLLVKVEDFDTGDPIFSGQVRLYNSGLGYDQTQFTDQKGETYFIPLESATYNLEVQAPNYTSYSDTVSVSGDNLEVVEIERTE